MNDKLIDRPLFRKSTTWEQKEQILKENCEFLTSKNSDLIKDMLLNILIHIFDNIVSDRNEFTITYKTDNFDKASLILTTNPYEYVKAEISISDITISKQNGHVEFEQVSKFPTEFLYMFK